MGFALASRWLHWTAVGCLALGFIALPARGEDPKPTPQRTTADPPQRPQADLTQYLKVMRDRLDELNLTAEQKTKVDSIFAKTADDLKKVQEENKDADQQTRMQKAREVLGGIRGQVGEILTDEQKVKFQELAARGPGARTAGAGIDALSKNLEKLDLSDDQKAKLKTLTDDTRKAMEDLRTQAQKDGNRDGIREKAQNITQDMRAHLMEILTPEQAAKLKELMSANRPVPPGEKPVPTEKKGT